jgi:hypothetical protein
MNTDMMTNLYRPGAPWEWPLRRSQATRLAAAPVARWLQVTSGRVWLTESGAGPEGDDVWLRAGERQLLPAGSEWVIEGWPEARVEVLEVPLAAVNARPRWRAWLAAA